MMKRRIFSGFSILFFCVFSAYSESEGNTGDTGNGGTEKNVEKANKERNNDQEAATSHKRKRNIDALSFDFAWNGDLATNTMGGVDQGAVYLGTATLGFSFDSEEAGLWKGGKLRISGKNTHGKSPSEELYGDRFFADNGDGGNYTYLYELWYRQSFGDKFYFTIGMQDINNNFATHDDALTFINTSSVMSSIFNNVNTPTFPLTGLGLELGWNINDKFRWQTCAYDGHVGDLTDSKHNFEWKLDKNEGYLLATEVQFAHEKAGTYKIGADFLTESKQFALYANGCKSFGMCSVFGVAAFAPKKKNDIFAMVNAGVNFRSIFAKRYEDILGFICGGNFLSDSEKHETILELTYKYYALKMFYVQPDIQFIINPSAQPDLDNALGIIVRVGVEL